MAFPPIVTAFNSGANFPASRLEVNAKRLANASQTGQTGLNGLNGQNGLNGLNGRQAPTSQTLGQANPSTGQTGQPATVSNAPSTIKNLSEADRNTVNSFIALYNAETTAEGKQAKYNAALQTLKSPEAVQYLNEQITAQSKALNGQAKTDFMEKWGKLLAMLIPVLINNGRVDANQVAWWKEAFPMMYGLVKPN